MEGNQTVENILLHGEKVGIGEEVTVNEAVDHLRDMGYADYVDSRTPVVRGNTLAFEQENAEKGA